jgi:hypothetical protein
MTARDISRLLLLCAAGALLTASSAGAQMGEPDVPTGTGPHCLTPAPVEPPTSDLVGVIAPWSGLALRPLIQPTWPFPSVVPPTAWFHHAVLRELRGKSLPISRAAAGRIGRR